MIIVRVELHSAIDGTVTEIARATICNDGTGTADRADYNVAAWTGRTRDALDASYRSGKPGRDGRVIGYRRRARHVWNLVAQALSNMGYE